MVPATKTLRLLSSLRKEVAINRVGDTQGREGGAGRQHRHRKVRPDLFLRSRKVDGGIATARNLLSHPKLIWKEDQDSPKTNGRPLDTLNEDGETEGRESADGAVKTTKNMKGHVKKDLDGSQGRATGGRKKGKGKAVDANGEKESTLRLRIDLDLDLELELKAKIQGAVTLALLD